MKLREWDDEGMRPSFGHEGDWLLEVLIALDAIEIASYAIDVPEGRRFLIATDLGLVDAVGGDEGRVADVRARLLRWQDVRAPELDAVISIDASARHVIRFELRVAEPPISIARAAVDERSDDRAIVSFARELVLRAGRPSSLHVGEPEE